MLNLIEKSRNSKLNPPKPELPTAATYRAGNNAPFGTCPDTCPLMPAGEVGATEFDSDYAASVSVAVPREGYAFTFTHFPPDLFVDLYQPGRTVINASAAGIDDAARLFKNGAPVVMDIEPFAPKRFSSAGVDFKACPATYGNRVTCNNCGGSRGPICAQPDRNHVVTFPWHGSKPVMTQAIESGAATCYGATGFVWIHWQDLAGRSAPMPESELESRVADLPEGVRLRHHVVGDLGRAA